MKKCFALFLSLALLLSCVTAAFAEEIGVVPYEIAALDTVIYIPENMTVTDETETDENVSVTTCAQWPRRLRLRHQHRLFRSMQKATPC
ncbi:MAG: hypothetical protein ACLS7Z_06270 [Christensenellales bacterium]